MLAHQTTHLKRCFSGTNQKKTLTINETVIFIVLQKNTFETSHFNTILDYIVNCTQLEICF